MIIATTIEARSHKSRKQNVRTLIQIHVTFDASSLLIEILQNPFVFGWKLICATNQAKNQAKNHCYWGAN